jgi:hypothetical protein
MKTMTWRKLKLAVGAVVAGLMITLPMVAAGHGGGHGGGGGGHGGGGHGGGGHGGGFSGGGGHMGGGGARMGGGFSGGGAMRGASAVAMPAVLAAAISVALAAAADFSSRDAQPFGHFGGGFSAPLFAVTRESATPATSDSAVVERTLIAAARPRPTLSIEISAAPEAVAAPQGNSGVVTANHHGGLGGTNPGSSNFVHKNLAIPPARRQQCRLTIMAA